MQLRDPIWPWSCNTYGHYELKQLGEILYKTMQKTGMLNSYFMVCHLSIRISPADCSPYSLSIWPDSSCMYAITKKLWPLYGSSTCMNHLPVTLLMVFLFWHTSLWPTLTVHKPSELLICVSIGIRTQAPAMIPLYGLKSAVSSTALSRQLTK